MSEINSEEKQKEYSGPFTINEFRKKDFRDSNIEIVKTLEKKGSFTRYLIAYGSEGLRITGMMNVPKGKGPFPVVILNHGRYNPDKHFIGAGFKKSADTFAREGYVAIGSDYRNYGESDKGKNVFAHLGSLNDVLYLVQAVKKISFVDKEKIGMWGYSGGGWLTLKAIIIDRSITVAALFGSMSADDIDNYKRIYKWHPEVIDDVNMVIGSPDEKPDIYEKMSPINFLKDMPNYIIMHRGADDKVIPVEWSERLRDELIRENKVVEYYTYPRQGHGLNGKARDISMERTVVFFNRYLKK
jgi:dipeptidyl aminopeptidase/acylaminoacyl peptidase